MTILSQITILVAEAKLNEEKTFFIDQCPSRPDLVGVKCKYLSNGDGEFRLQNTIDDCIEAVDPDLICIIDAA